MFYFDEAEDPFHSVAAEFRDIRNSMCLLQSNFLQTRTNLPKKKQRVKEASMKRLMFLAFDGNQERCSP
jgi:hypothetical protein